MLILIALGTHFKLVEAFTVDTDDSTLRYKGVGIYFVDKLKYLVRFVLFGQNEQHLHLVARVKALGIDNRHTAMGIVVDALTDLLVFVGDDKELYRPAHGVHHLVDT